MPDDSPTDPMNCFDTLSEAAKLEMARRLIAATYPGPPRVNERRTLPDPETLAKAVSNVHQDYFTRCLFDLMPGIDKFTNAYADLKSQAKKLQASMNVVLQTPHVYNELLASVANRYRDLDIEGVSERFNLLNQIAGEFAAYAGSVQSEFEAMRKQNPSQSRLYEMEEGGAQHWLFGHAIPVLFQTHFGTRYSIRGDAKTGTSGSKFAMAFLAETGLPRTSLANLRKHTQRARARGVCPKATDQKD